MFTAILQIERDTITHVAETSAGYATLDGESYLRTWSRDGKPLGKVKAGAGRMISLRSLLVGPDGAVLTGTTKIAAYDPVTAKRVREWPGHGKHAEVTGLALTQDGTRLVSGAKVALVSNANGVRIWDYAAGGKALEAVALTSKVRKPPCEVNALGRAPGSDTCFALAYSRMSPEDTVGGVPYLFRIDGTEAQRIAELSPPGERWGSHVTVLNTLAITDSYAVVSKGTQYPGPTPQDFRFAPSLEVFSHDGALVTVSALEPARPSERGYRYELISVSPDGTRLAVVGDGIEMRSLPSLDVIERIPVPASVDALVFASDGSLLVAMGAQLHRLTPAA